EEQNQEIEILESIYPDEMIHIKSNEFKIIVNLDYPGYNSRKKSVLLNKQLLLHVIYPPKYPEEVPQLSVKYYDAEYDDGQDIEDDYNYGYSDDEYNQEQFDDSDTDTEDDEAMGETALLAKRSRQKEDIAYLRYSTEDFSQLSNVLEKTALENLGLPSIFTVVSMLKEEAETIFNAKVAEINAKRQQIIDAAEREEQKKFTGTTVTRENFDSWKLSFAKEMGWDKKEEIKKAALNGKLTGKELFEKGLTKGEDEFDEVEETTATVA
ncbi:RWD-domain-containing protein, partial [Nadsonia fulvescens var. elongata DSM 6958]